MPRNPAAKKGHHNNRHENGLVGPGKRVTKQKSNGQLNGNAKPAAAAAADEPVPDTLHAQSIVEPSSVPTGADMEQHPETTVDGDEMRWRKRGSESSSDGQDQRWDNANGTISHNSSKTAETTQTKSKGVQYISAMQVASTILKSCPAGDTVALLIVLLALPSLILTIVQALFASLTLMPPSGGASPVSFLSLFDVFQGSAGSPSLGTMAVVDVICFGAWVCLWGWAQNFALDLAQIQIAITLGSGNSGKNGGVNTFCFLLVLVLHSARSRGLRQFVQTNMFPASVLNHPRVAELTKYLPTESDFGTSSGPPSKIRSLFAIHIISQALMAFVRRRVAGTSTSTKPTKRVDSDLFSGNTTVLEPSAQDSLFNTAASPGGDYPTPPTPTVKESKDKLLSAKKRRRQANQVRSRQPFWAALASTKVHVLRDVEHKKEKANPASAQDDLTRGELDGCIWITSVEPSTIHFEAGRCALSQNGRDAVEADSFKPFYVRINKARWHSVTMDYVDDDVCDDGFPTKWTGSIAGLAPDCNYRCSFIRIEDNQVIASIMVRTPALEDKDQPNAAAPVAARQSSRPNSPTTTLKTSIQTAERTREEIVNKRNKNRRNQKNALAKLDREMEAQQNKLRSAGDDNKLRQKLLQAERSSRQHEEAASSISVQLEELETIPEEDLAEYDKKKAIFEAHTKKLSEANESLSEAKSALSHELNCAKNELTATVGRKERLTARNAKLAAEQERLMQANIQNLSEKERRAVESATREKDQQRQESEWQQRIKDLDAQMMSVRMQNMNLYREIEKFEMQQRNAMLAANGPLPSEGEFPGAVPQHPRAFMLGNMHTSTFIPDPQASPFQSLAKPIPTDARRPRSGTNQSTGGMSRLSSDFDDPDPIPPMPSTMDFDVGIGINGRKGSGSSRGKNNHSPAAIGVIGTGLRSPHRDGHSPGHMQVTSTW
ncbi:hypothetical protein H2198_007769 [Neophaeococcomyces mojaviensis]|uniref:Uncharacterized protein n=1 Tax=Neophaeococcomyces mojaviensis TaxID=3383035 RepID=A0ACC2ZZK7_9EURO|nr:hypothetical protein H2198_007769 [Knufia sp. JES_112]